MRDDAQWQFLRGLIRETDVADFSKILEQDVVGTDPIVPVSWDPVVGALDFAIDV